jgi:hypothetical protein
MNNIPFAMAWLKRWNRAAPKAMIAYVSIPGVFASQSAAPSPMKMYTS